ncbi:hypothetical protein [Pontibacter chinhatensis]|nr:hypothetical protein [Pontibacter chinhatensis]
MPYNIFINSIPKPLSGFVASSHHISQSDVLNGYCLPFYTAHKDFNR